jgi:hypothetical protein
MRLLRKLPAAAHKWCRFDIALIGSQKFGGSRNGDIFPTNFIV